MWWSLTRWSSTSRVGVSAGGGGAGDAVAGPGGALFIGDVRNLSLLEAFTTGVVCADDAYGHSSAAVVRERIRREILAEQELLLAPEFFVALPDYLPDIAAVDVQLKRMHAVNELSGYRYEVVLRKAPVSVRSLAQVPAQPWERFGSLARLGSICDRRIPRRCVSPGCRMPG